jgi:glycerophosphoryl diester phosphodiesterase
VPLPPALEASLESRGYLRIAHRGAPSFGIDNSDRAILAALEHQPDLVEIDVHFTSDGQLILWHDHKIEHAGQQLEIAKTSLERLQEVRLSDGSRLVTLEEAMNMVRGTCGLLVDLKADGLAEAIIECTHKTKLETVVVCGGYFETLRKIKLLEPRIAVSYTPEFIPFGLNPKVKADFLDALTVYWRTVTPGFLKASKARGIQVIAWTVDEPTQMRKLIGMGISGITTNRIEMLAKLELQREPPKVG